jgi:hypothetical protein
VIPPTDRDAELVLRRDAVQNGWSDEELARLARAGQWNRLRRGAYLDGQLPGTAVARHALLVAATLAGLRRSAVVSHQSAAVLLGLPMWGAQLGRVHITRDEGWEVVRWTWSDLTVPDRLGERVRRAHERGSRGRS